MTPQQNAWSSEKDRPLSGPEIIQLCWDSDNDELRTVAGSEAIDLGDPPYSAEIILQSIVDIEQQALRIG